MFPNPANATPGQLAFIVLYHAIFVAGLVLLWRVQLSPAARARRTTTPVLEPWAVPGAIFSVAALCVFGGGLLVPSFVVSIAAAAGLPYDRSSLGMLVQGLAFQGGLLVGVIVAAIVVNRPPNSLDTLTEPDDANSPRPPPLPSSAEAADTAADEAPSTNPWLASVTVFLISVPLVSLAGYAFTALLEAVGLPTKSQAMIELFKNAESRPQLAVMIFLAVIMAPLAEELIFRAGLFRFLRTRVPRWVALWVPSTLFAALHVDWSNLDGLPSLLPLVILAAIYSIAYERTRRIDVVIIAHSLFNLHTVAVLLLGIDQL